MINISKRTISLLVVTLLLISTFLSAPITTQAASYPTTHPNTYTNTGNGAVDITEIAKTQVGYKENSVGTKYGYWYNPAFVSQPWCAMFVSWCADQAGISGSVIKPFASCSMGVRWFQSEGIWYDSAYYGGTYVPKKGDIIFYRNGGSSNLSDHVGIVLGVNGTYINVIEGNATNESCCEYKTNTARSLNNKYVIGYGTPKYEGNTIEIPEEEPVEYENWQITSADSLSLRKSFTTSSQRLATMPQGSLLQVTDFEVTDDYLWGYTKYNGKEGWCALDYCTYLNGSIDGVYYQLPPEFTTKTATVYVQQKLKLKSENTLTATYKSSDKSVVKVNKYGKVTGVSKGTAQIICTTPTGETKATITVNNPTLKEKTLTTCIGDTCQVQLVGGYGTLTYKSNNTNIATVDDKGIVTGVAEGETKIVVTIPSGAQLKCTVKVNKESDTYERFVVAESNVYLKDDYQGKDIVLIPEETQLKITEVKYSSTYTWGKTTYNDKEGWVILNSCQYVGGSFNGEVLKTAPYLAETKKTVFVGETYTLQPMSCEGKNVYVSRNTGIATVDKNGVVTALKAGKVNVVVKNSGKVLKCKITVKNPYLSKTELHMGKKERVPLSVTGGSGDIKWKSSAKKIAKVTADGIVIGKKVGTATSTATRNDGVMECVVNVYVPKLSETNTTVKVGEKKFLKVSQNYSSEITWKSSNKKIVKVSKYGRIKGIKKGTATVTAEVDGITLKCTVTVK